MALTVYYSWDNLGRPLTPAWPIREFVGKMKLAFPTAAATSLFGWYADESHYQTNFPEDHTPFSVTGWPEADPPWWVCATDVMHRPDLGVDCGVLVPYWLAEARAERMPWLKYLIWQAQMYDVRNEWEPVETSATSTMPICPAGQTISRPALAAGVSRPKPKETTTCT
jgi:hypothetical protein